MNYTYRKSLREDPDRYKVGKEQIADLVVGLLGRRFLRLAAPVEMRDMVTLITFHRYTGN